MERRQSSTETGTTNSSVARPGSVWTDDSIFVDSAVGMGAITTPPLKRNSAELARRAAPSISPISQSLADRLRRLAAAAWVLEQDDDMSELKRSKIERTLMSLENTIEDDRISDTVNNQAASVTQYFQERAEDEQESDVESEVDQGDWISESDLFQVHDNLLEVVTSMRLRQQEQRHLHQLTTTKLEAIAQKCLFQERQMQDLVKEMESLRHENRQLGQENDGFRDTINELQSEASKKEVAVSAMTSAVAGLEGWMDDADRSSLNQYVVTTPGRGSRQRRAVTKGKGRFRGRYYVDETQDGYFSENLDAQELQDGVRAWIRGFRDVEDACSSPVPGRVKEQYRASSQNNEDEWGDFESAAPTPL